MIGLIGLARNRIQKRDAFLQKAGNDGIKCGLSVQRSYVTFIHLLTRCSILFYIDISHRFCANCKILCLKLSKRTKELLK